MFSIDFTSVSARCPWGFSSSASFRLYALGDLMTWKLDPVFPFVFGKNVVLVGFATV